MHNRAEKHTPEAGGYGLDWHIIHQRLNEIEHEQFHIFVPHQFLVSLLDAVNYTGGEFRKAEGHEKVYEVRLWTEEDFSLTLIEDDQLPRDTFKIVAVKT